MLEHRAEGAFGIKVVGAAKGYPVLYTEGIDGWREALTDEEVDAYAAEVEGAICEALDAIDAEFSELRQQHRQEEDTQRLDLNTQAPAPARGAGEVVPASRLEAKRAEVALRREALDAVDCGEADDEGVNPIDALEPLGVSHVDSVGWFIEGSKGKTWHVSTHNDKATACSCPDRKYRKRRCKHMALVDELPAALAGVCVLLDKGHTIEEVSSSIKLYISRGDARESVVARLATVSTDNMEGVM